MVVNKISSKREFLNIIDNGNNSYAKVSSFAYYPFINRDNDDNYVGNKAKIADLPKSYIYDKNNEYRDEFLKNINIDNYAFVGLNAANHNQQHNSNYKTSFQTMHEANNTKSKDFYIARMLRDAIKGDKAKGSFMFDIISNVIATKLSVAPSAITKIKNKPNSEFKLSDEPFNLNKIKSLHIEASSYVYPILSNSENITAEYKYDCLNELSKINDYIIITKELDKNDPNFKQDLDDLIEINNGVLRSIKDRSIEKLTDHIMKYDLPAFVYLMRMLRPKLLLCFGTNTFNLVDTLLNKTELKDSLGIHAKKNNSLFNEYN